VGDGITVFTKKNWVADGKGEGNANAVVVGSEVTVGGAVFVMVGASAVCV
jgi:hypothetical protein